MAKLAPGAFGFTGSFHNLSAYTARGIDGIIIRRKGGPSRKQVKKHPNFDITRRNNSEFGARSTVTKWIKAGLNPINLLADYNFIGFIQRTLIPIQKMDTINERGRRAVCLSKSPGLLEGFSVNKKNTLDTTIRSPLHFELSKDDLSATVQVPELLPGVNFSGSPYHPFFSIYLSLAVVPDLFWTEHGYKANEGYVLNNFHETKVGEWFAVKSGCGTQQFSLKINKAVPDKHFSLMLAVGVAYGELGPDQKPRQVKHAGSGKIVGVV